MNPALLTIALDKTGSLPMHMQLTQQMRELIVDKRLSPGDRLPSTRAFAVELSVSRITVVTAFDQLISEGYAEAQSGSGTYVAQDIPDFGSTPLPAPKTERPKGAESPLVASARLGQPDLRAFPFAQWTKVFDAVWRHPADALQGTWPAFGALALRRSICRHLFQWRGLKCEPEQVVITSGISEAISLIAQCAVPPGAELFMEDPCLPRLRDVVARNGLRPRPVPVDNLGFDLDCARRISASAMGVLVTPSQQYPLGMTLPLARRIAILNWAQSVEGLVLEDDYDGEYRHEGDPVPALMSLDRFEVAIYIGSFSKTLFPGLRLGFVILPPRLIAPMQDTIKMRGSEAGQMLQPVVARFIDEGYFTSHLRKMRTLYRKRRDLMQNAIAEHATDIMRASASSSGMHTIAEVTVNMPDIKVAAHAAQSGLAAWPLSSFFARAEKPKGLVLGFAAARDDKIATGVRQMVSAVKAAP